MAAAAAHVAPEELREEIISILQGIYDPEIPVNIHELGLIYAIEIDEGGAVEIRMTLTAPGCPVAGPMVDEVQHKVAELPGVATCHVELVWEPPWTMDRMSEAARLQLGMF
ncbi:MAG: SUF system Fe-S cluster assembly protein [Deltaproteobacteria bacterium]|nr:SUF system Fe-S cluster assembly protein [Deltaproteobacteria bacterium]